MQDISDQEFDKLITEAMEELPQEYIERLDNVAIVYEDVPSADQREKLRLRCDESLLGLYEGIPLTRRTAGYNLVLPDKITLFKKALAGRAGDRATLKAEIKHTLWHEIAHYYGLDHERIHSLEKKHLL